MMLIVLLNEDLPGVMSGEIVLMGRRFLILEKQKFSSIATFGTEKPLTVSCIANLIFFKV